MYVDQMKEKGGLFKVTVDLTGAYDDQKTKDELCDPDTKDPYVFEFRELNADEFRDLVAVDQKKQMALLEKKMADCLISHNLRNSTRDIVPNEEAIAEIRQYGSLLYFVVMEWQKQIPLLKRSAELSAE